MMTTTTLPLSRPARPAAARSETAGWTEDCLARLAAGEDTAAAELASRCRLALRAPAALRERVVAACAAEAPAGAPPALLDRLWCSRRARAVVPRQLDLALGWREPAPGPVWVEQLAGSGGSGWD